MLDCMCTFMFLFIATLNIKRIQLSSVSNPFLLKKLAMVVLNNLDKVHNLMNAVPVIVIVVFITGLRPMTAVTCTSRR